MRKFYLFILIISVNHSVAEKITDKLPINHENNGFIDEIITVGTDQACDFNDIQAAINSVPDGSKLTYEIRVTNQQEWNTSLVVENKDNFRIFGRFADCHDATNNFFSGNRSIINNVNPSFAGIFINNSLSTVIGLVEIKNGNNSGVIISNGSNVDLHNVMIHENNKTSGNGGGVLVINSDLSVFYSYIEGNHANNGGGIACESSFLSILRTSVNGNKTNQTGGKGGGIFINDCIVSLTNTPGGEAVGLGITNNSAARYGGGIYVDSGSFVGINSQPDTFDVGQFIIANNSLSNSVTNLAGGGAGIYATGTETEVLAYATSITNNKIENNLQFVGGAAIAVHDQAKFFMFPRANKINCDNQGTDDRSCNQVGNNVTKSGDAAVIKITGGSEARIYNASIFGNETLSTTNQLASVIDGDLTMQGVLVYDNGPIANPPMVQFPTRLFRVSTAGTFHGDFMTIIDNRLWNGSVIQSFNSSKVNLTRSIAQTVNSETLYNDSGNPSTTLFKCLLTDENSSFSGTQITVDDPVFQPTLPYRLSASSAGVDMCTHSFGDLVPEVDIDGEQRGPCPGACPPQRFDVGADEFTTSDLIFKNGFEFLL